MKKYVLFLTILVMLPALQASSQCGRISLIGEFNYWLDDHFMTRDPEQPSQFTTIFKVTSSDDPNWDGIVEMKFRENADWTHTWGNVDFPSGTAILNGPNLPVPYGSYFITFDCETGAYNFETYNTVGIVGEFNGWQNDYPMYRDEENPDMWSTVLNCPEENDPNGDGIIEMKFRQNEEWIVYWGDASFPSGIGTQYGPNIPVPYGNYYITLNVSTGAYNFITACGEISLIGEFGDWGEDRFLTRDPVNPNLWRTILTLTGEDDAWGSDNIVEMKFRENGDWYMNWGSPDFPSGTGVINGMTIPVPLDGTGLTTDYRVTFNCVTGEYNFEAASGPVSIIGDFTDWTGDVPMNRDAADPNLWKLTRSWYADSYVKFRENNDWTMHWGSSDWPSGTGVQDGPNIPLVQGKYDVTFNAETGEFDFISNPDICGEIGLVGDFNNWGEGDPPTDVWMVRDPVYPSNFSVNHTFAEPAGLLFRMDADETFTNVWGGTSLCQTGIQDATYVIPVPKGTYYITFNCKSGDYCFEKRKNSVNAPRVSSMNPDGILDENDWGAKEPVTRIFDGEVLGDLNEVYFRSSYNEQLLYIGIEVKDAAQYSNDRVTVFIDGNNSDGEYDDHDLYMDVFSSGGYHVYRGPDNYAPEIGYAQSDTGYTFEVALPLAVLGIDPEEGDQIGLDLWIADDDGNPGYIDYFLSWNGNLTNNDNTSVFGDLVFGSLICGCISVYNETTGDIILHSPADQETTFVGTYEYDNDYGIVFRKDLAGDFSWGSGNFPEGTAQLGGPPIPAVAGRYRITFDCRSGTYTFISAPAGADVAFADYAGVQPVVDGDLAEYNLLYGSEILTMGNGPVNNVISWGVLWDNTSFYIGARVTDETVEGSGDPWENDAIEFFLDGNNDKDGAYDTDFDTHMILDALNQSSLWIKTNGVPVTDYEASWISTELGYNVELRFGWSNIGFAPGKGRVIGWSLGNDDSDNGTGRDYQTVWTGTADNGWNTAYLGELQLAGGPYIVALEEFLSNTSFNLYPNPSTGMVYLQTTTNELNGDVVIVVSDISGKTQKMIRKHLNGINDILTIGTGEMAPGLYIVNILTESGRRAVKKLIVY
ncbi:MAG TPA: sugar-binding protein [Bacteroidales bacterium]|nr:sugar-binding protein [Bacteroidales bacterium]